MSNSDKPDQGCINHGGAINSSGYGVVSVKGKTKYAHREAYKKYFGAIGDGLVVMHNCDNKACVNPLHLSQGTHSDNMKDMTSKERQARGESHGRSKLTSQQVKAIRESTETCRALGARYNVHNTTISEIKRGVIWDDALLAELDK